MDNHKKKTVFISHNNEDKNIAREIGLFLIAENINVWFDEWVISAGESIPAEINKGLNNCTHFIILWSRNSAKSNWVKRELNSILSESIVSGGYPKIIPIILDDTERPALLKDLKYIRYINGIEKDRTEIIQSITGKLPTQNYIKAIVKKYNEVIYNGDVDQPFSLNACPRCGSNNFKRYSHTDYASDEMYYIIDCLECGWSNWTQ